MRHVKRKDDIMSREQRRMERLRKKRRRRTILALIFILLIVIVGIPFAVSHFSTDVYQDADEFEKYADAELDKYGQFVPDGDAETEYAYDSPISYAVENGGCDDESIASYRDGVLTKLRESFSQEKTAEEAERAEKQNDDDLRPLEHAMLIRTGVFSAERGIRSLVIYRADQVEKDKEMVQEASAVYAYNFYADTGRQLLPQQIFTERYREVCAQYFSEYFPKSYKEEELGESWKDFISASENNYNKFAVTDKGVTFYFDEGTVLKSSYGVVAVGMTVSDLGGTLREKPIYRIVDPDKPMVALTYDDGPGGKAETRILDCLEKYGEVATFFYLGNRVSGDSENVKRAFDMGCQIGNHTWNHPNLSKLKEKEAVKQLTDTNAAVKEVTGDEPSVFRPSYGITSDAINKASGVPVIMWDVDTLDWKSRDAKKVFKAVKKKSSLDGSIILMHSIYDSTAEATELIVPWLREKGYQMVTVSELIKYKSGHEPQAGHVYSGF